MGIDIVPQTCHIDHAYQSVPSGASTADAIPLQWFCIKTASKAERLATLGLSEAGFRSWFPQIAVQQTRYGRTEKVTRPLFPSYIFVQISPGDAWGIILRTAGVQRLFTGSAGQPAPLQRGEIERLQSMGRAGDGVLDDDAPAFSTLIPGQSVRITAGPFADRTVICRWSDHERVEFLMTLFGAERQMSVARVDVEVV